ncbi:DUF4870 domain-containing protein [Mesonia ostreae]|uniref:Chloroplast import component protein (Tic20) n=1 Tax=Mesonia ostreae TaxID=861110 RepID=A0ABU2KEF5_9FLAO|nr:hypothetical protein [Mesonia ostreae]MDT0293083.1 hypothetical protein [Mesonia ostreae]
MNQTLNSSEVESGKTTAIISYLTFVGCIIAIFMNIEPKNKFASFHIRQAIGIHLLQILVFTTMSGFDSFLISFPLWIFFFVLWFYAFLGVVQGKRYLVPILGEHFQNWFNKIAP